MGIPAAPRRRGKARQPGGGWGRMGVVRPNPKKHFLSQTTAFLTGVTRALSREKPREIRLRMGCATPEQGGRGSAENGEETDRYQRNPPRRFGPVAPVSGAHCRVCAFVRSASRQGVLVGCGSCRGDRRLAEAQRSCSRMRRQRLTAPLRTKRRNDQPSGVATRSGCARRSLTGVVRPRLPDRVR